MYGVVNVGVWYTLLHTFLSVPSPQNTHILSRSLSLSLSLSHTHTHTHTRTDRKTHRHRHTHIHTLSLSLSHSRTDRKKDRHRHTHSLSHTHTHTHTHRQTRSPAGQRVRKRGSWRTHCFFLRQRLMLMTRMRTKSAAAVEPSTMARNFSSDTPTPDAARPLAEIHPHHSEQ